MTTTTFYATETGFVVDWTAVGAFTTIRAGSGTFAYNDQWLSDYQLSSNTTSDQFDYLERDFYSFDTSSIGTDTITSATVSLYYYYKVGNLGSPGYGITGCSPASPTTFVAGDYDSFTDTRLATDKTYDAFSSYQYYDWDLNASGLAYINKSGYTTFCGRLDWDIDNSFGGAWASAKESGIRFYMNDGAKYPKLTVVHAPSDSPKTSFVGHSTCMFK